MQNKHSSANMVKPRVYCFQGELGIWGEGNQHKYLTGFWCCQAPLQAVELRHKMCITWQLTAEHESPSLPLLKATTGKISAVARPS